jgi:hypothetical protein
VIVEKSSVGDLCVLYSLVTDLLCLFVKKEVRYVNIITPFGLNCHKPCISYVRNIRTSHV